MEAQYHDQQHHRHDVNPLFVGLLGVIAGAIIVATVHCMILGWCNAEQGEPLETRESQNQHPQNVQTSRTSREHGASSSNMSNPSVRLNIPIFKYTKGCKEGTCSICLGEFNENDELRVLPECAHPFHVPCIDTWLISHPNCPLCRTDIFVLAPANHVLVPLANGDGAFS